MKTFRIPEILQNSFALKKLTPLCSPAYTVLNYTSSGSIWHSVNATKCHHTRERGNKREVERKRERERESVSTNCARFCFANLHTTYRAFKRMRSPCAYDAIRMRDDYKKKITGPASDIPRDSARIVYQTEPTNNALKRDTAD